MSYKSLTKRLHPDFWTPNRKPITDYAIDLSHPLCPSLYWTFGRSPGDFNQKGPGALGWSATAMTDIAPNAAVEVAGGMQGIRTGRASGDTYAARCTINSKEFYDAFPPITLFCTCLANTVVDWSGVFGHRTGSVLTINPRSGGNLSYTLGSDYGWDSGIAIPTNRIIRLLLQVTGSDIYLALFDGVDYWINSKAKTAGQFFSEAKFSVGGDGYSGRGWDGLVYDAGIIHGRVLSTENIKYLLTNPYAFLRPANERIWVPVSGLPLQISRLGLFGIPVRKYKLQATSSSGVNIYIQETATASDSNALNIKLVLQEAAVILENNNYNILAKVTDVLNSVDSETALILLKVLDSLSGTDTDGVKALLNITDALTTTDSNNIKALLSITDNLLSVDSLSALLLIQVLDSVTGTDTESINTLVNIVDNLSTLESNTISNVLKVTDILSTTETISALLLVRILETASITDINNISALLSVLEASTIADSVNISNYFSIQDVLTSQENIFAGILISIIDSASGADSASLASILATILDNATSLETQSIFASLKVAEVATLQDSQSIKVDLSLADSANITDSSALLEQIFKILESVLGVENLSTSKVLSITDTAIFNDEAKIKSLLKILETVQGTDTVVVLNGVFNEGEFPTFYVGDSGKVFYVTLRGSIFYKI